MANVFRRDLVNSLFFQHQRILVAMLQIFAFQFSFAQQARFVDMGVMTNDGKNLLWADGDLSLTEDNEFVLLNDKKIGDDFYWGDITGIAKYNKTSQSCGSNPPTEISGNPKYDICTAKLGDDYRLPTHEEIKRLLSNCILNISIKDYNYPEYNSSGVPTWIYGEWMWQNSSGWYSLKFDNIFVTVLSSANGYMQALYQGPYGYKDGKIIIPKLFKLTIKNGALEADNGTKFEQISRQTRAGSILYAQLISKINGNKLNFIIDAGQNVLKMNDPRHIKGVHYWSGSLDPDGTSAAMSMWLRENGEMEVDKTSRMSHFRIRPVKEYIDPVAQKLYRERREKEIQDSLIAIERAKAERRRQDSIQLVTLTENVKKTPLLNAFLETSEVLGNQGFFNVKKVASDGNTTTYYVYATSNSLKAYKNFWKKVVALTAPDSYWEKTNKWTVNQAGQGYPRPFVVGKPSPLTSNFHIETYSFYYMGESDRGDYKEEKNGKTYAWVRLNSTKNYLVANFSQNEKTASDLFDLFNCRVVENILSEAALGSMGYEVKPTTRKGNYALMKDDNTKGLVSIVPVTNIPKSDAILPIESNGFSLGTGSNRRVKACIPFLIEECKAGDALYKVEITFTEQGEL